MTIQLTGSRSGDLEIATVTIDNAPMNVIDLEHCHELISCLHEVHADDRARLVVLRGGGDAFSAGLDIKQHTVETMPELLPVFHQVFDALLRLQAVTFAAIHGPCLGGGAELAFACDRIVAERSARIGFPEINVGCYPPVALALLPYRAGPGRAVELILGGAEMNVERLAGWGMVDRLVEPGDLDAGLAAEFALFAGKSPTVLGWTAGLLHQEARRAWAERIAGYEQEYLEVLLPHPDVAEGIAAFNEKRPARWKGPDPLVSPDEELL